MRETLLFMYSSTASALKMFTSRTFKSSKIIKIIKNVRESKYFKPPLDYILVFLLDQPHSFQYVGDVVYPPLLLHCQAVCSLLIQTDISIKGSNQVAA